MRQIELRQSDRYASNAALILTLKNPVVVAVAVLGSETAEALGTQRLITRGTRACRPAVHGPQSSISRMLDNKDIIFTTILAL